MTINGLVLPASFVTDVQQGVFRRQRGSWQLIHDVDAWGHHLETELSEVYEEEKRLVDETQKLQGFLTVSFDGPDTSMDEPGFIPYITDFSKIVCFGVSGEDDPFCFDFRADPLEPEIIWWEDAFWRRIAPNWTSFTALFNLTLVEDLPED